MSNSAIGYPRPRHHVQLPQVGHGFMRFWAFVRRDRHEPVFAVRIPRFTDIPPT